MSKIIVAGSINMDVVAQTARHPLPGETIFGDALHYIPGGKGSNQAVAASRLSDDVMLLGKLGKDPFGESLQAFLQNENLDLSYLLQTSNAPTGVAIIVVDAQSENSIIVISGANYDITPEDIANIDISPDDVVVSVFEIPQLTIKALFEKAKHVGATTILNPAPATIFEDGLQNLVDYLIVNETELAFYAHASATPTNSPLLQKQAQALQSHPGQTIIITLGAKGVVCLQNDTWHEVSGQLVKAIDTTGAGDCFTGALAVALYEQMPITDALHFANTSAAISVQKLGASTSMPTRDMIDKEK